ncbi:MAG: zinc-dependent metalloprotease [Flavobacteriaceae bacterium]
MKLHSLGRGLIFLILCSLLNSANLKAQVPTITETDPSTLTWGNQPTVNLSELNVIRSQNYGNQELYVKIYVHVLRRSDGSDGESVEGINRMLQILYDDFDPLGIHFVRDRYGSIDYIDNDAYFVHPNTYINDIFNTNGHSDGIDIYVFDDLESATNGGGTTGVGQGTALILGGYLYLAPKKYFAPIARTHFISQLMGKIFYLYNTHFGTDGNPNGCPELVNGTNCEDCGDYICDTPADPNILFSINQLQGICDYDPDPNGPIPLVDANGDPYDPDTLNIMSYTLFSCMQHFTPQQVTRMKNAIGFLPHLQAAQVQNYAYIRPQTDCYACSEQTAYRDFMVHTNYNISSLSVNHTNNIDVNVIGSGSNYIQLRVFGQIAGEGELGNFSIVRAGFGINGLIEATQQLWVGLPETIPDHTIDGNDTASSGQGVGYVLDNRIKGVENYLWENPEPSMVIYGGETNLPDVWQHYAYDQYYMFSAAYAGNQTGFVTVYGVNPCGTGDNGSQNEICVVNSDDPEGDTECVPVPGGIVYYPNPADDLLNIDLSLQNYEVFDIVIYDEAQTVVHSSQSENVVKTIDTFGLQNGTYYLHIYNNGQLLISKILIINH